MTDPLDPSKPPPGQPLVPARTAVIWAWAGLCAGAAVGAGDTPWAVGRGIGGLGALKALKLVLFGSSWFALCGLSWVRSWRSLMLSPGARAIDGTWRRLGWPRWSRRRS